MSDLNTWHRFVPRVFLEISTHVMSRHESVYPTEGKRCVFEVTWQQTSVRNLKILDSFRNQQQTTQIRETKQAKYLL